MLTEKSYDTGEIIVNYAEGPANGEPLVLLHGSTLRWQTFEGLLAPLSQSWHIYACDLRGHGKSRHATSGYRVIDYIPDTVAFIERHLCQPVVLLGFSTGALVAPGVTARLPDFIKALVLLDPPLILRDSSIQTTAPYEWFTWVDETLKSTSTIAEVVTRLKERDPEVDDETAASDAQMIHSLDPQAVSVILNDQHLAGLNLEQELSRVVCPTLLLYGESRLGGCVRDSDAEFFQTNMPSSKVVQIKEAGHGVHWEQPAVVLDHITQFLSSL
jgi:pimeloyl-ACP methyl ester carboxylesterase